jgi:phage tail-like protein
MDAVAPEAPRKDNFLYLNRDNAWLGLHREGLEIREDGSLRLGSLPLLEDQIDTIVEDPTGPAGIAIDSEGTIYVSDPENHRIVRTGCDGVAVVTPCIGSRGSLPVQFDTPRGILIPKNRRSLFVADSENHRVQVFDLASGQLVEIWGQPIGQEPQPGTEAGRFDTPWTLAGDDSGNVYVVDYRNRRVQKFNIAGDVEEQFWESAVSTQLLTRPSDIATFGSGEDLRLYVVDEAAHAVFVVDANGNLIRDTQNQPISFGKDELQKPMGIAVAADAVYVGDNARHRVLKFGGAPDYSLLGEALGYEGPIAALALNNQGSLLVHTGSSTTLVRLTLSSGYRTRGVLWSDAISIGGTKVGWHRVQAKTTKAHSTNAQLRLFFHTSDDQNDQPHPPDGDIPFADPRWIPAAVTPDPFSDAHDLFIGGDPSRYLWIGALFIGDGRDPSEISQIRVEFNHDGYLEELPAIYQADSTSRDFLARFLALVETFFQDLENGITDLTLLFDPHAVPKELLQWLADWLALELDEHWSEEKQRSLIASAFERYSRRGTVAALRESLRLFAGVTGIIEEPILNAGWWSLPSPTPTCGCHSNSGGAMYPAFQNSGNSILGMTTRLVSSHPQGAVLGATATLDYSNLVTNEQYGAPLFEDVAHQFSVQIYRTALQCPEALSRVRAVLDREKPAHTAYHLCVIEPRMRVGFQAYVGIDTLVGGSAQEIRLGDIRIDGTTALGGEPPRRVGMQSRMGIATRL